MVEIIGNWLRRRRNRPAKPQVECLGCGRCCAAFSGHLRASPGDLERWRRAGRDDLLARVNRLGWIWIDPRTGRSEERCPFLQPTGPDTARCAIHPIKPDICRAYPTLAHGYRCLRGVFLKASILVSGGLAAEVVPILDDLICLV